jgi:VWFA-related protein
LQKLLPLQKEDGEVSKTDHVIPSERVLIVGFVILLTCLAVSAASLANDHSSNAPQTQASEAKTQPAQSTPASTISVQVKVVNVLATVRDKHGKIISNLVKDDFVLTEDGRPQNIHYFTRETDIPLTLGLLVDTSLSQRRVLEQERTASHSFLNQMVRKDKDKAFVIHFDREVELLQDLTSSHQKLESALQDLEMPRLERTSTSNSPNSDPGARPGSARHMGGGGTLLYDAVYLASDELMKKEQGRKAVIVLSDGVDRGSKETIDQAIETAQRADTVVYSILFKDDEAYGGGGFGGPRIGMGGPGRGGGMGRRGGGRRFPQEARPISKETGGRLFEVSKEQPIDQIYAQIEEELRNQYSLGYTPDRAGGSPSGYHKIQLATKQKSFSVQTRDGYYAER